MFKQYWSFGVHTPHTISGCSADGILDIFQNINGSKNNEFAKFRVSYDQAFSDLGSRWGQCHPLASPSGAFLSQRGGGGALQIFFKEHISCIQNLPILVILMHATVK